MSIHRTEHFFQALGDSRGQINLRPGDSGMWNQMINIGCTGGFQRILIGKTYTDLKESDQTNDSEQRIVSY